MIIILLKIINFNCAFIPVFQDTAGERIKQKKKNECIIIIKWDWRNGECANWSSV